MLRYANGDYYLKCREINSKVKNFDKYYSDLYFFSQLLRCNTARGSSIGLVPVGPTKVKGHKSILFTEGEIKYTYLRAGNILYRWFSIHSRDSLSLVIPNNKLSCPSKSNSNINIVNTLNTLSFPSKSNGKLIELTVQTSCFWGLRLTLCYHYGNTHH